MDNEYTMSNLPEKPQVDVDTLTESFGGHSALQRSSKGNRKCTVDFSLFSFNLVLLIKLPTLTSLMKNICPLLIHAHLHATHSPSFSNPQFAPITLSPMQTP